MYRSSKCKLGCEPRENEYAMLILLNFALHFQNLQLPRTDYLNSSNTLDVIFPVMNLSCVTEI
jgi:hypothetical protein